MQGSFYRQHVNYFKDDKKPSTTLYTMLAFAFTNKVKRYRVQGSLAQRSDTENQVYLLFSLIDKRTLNHTHLQDVFFGLSDNLFLYYFVNL